MTAQAREEKQVTGYENQFRFEALVASICSELTNAGPESIDALMVGALRRIAEALGANRVLLGEADEVRRELAAKAQYHADGPAFPERMSIDEMNPELWRVLAAGEVMCVTDVAALPRTTDRNYFDHIDLRSFIAVPVIIDGVL